MGQIALNIITPQGTYGPYHCDSVHLTVCDSKNGKGGGSYGVRKGHAKALLALDEGYMDGFLSQKIVIQGKSGCGFATIDEDTITAVVESFGDTL